MKRFVLLLMCILLPIPVIAQNRVKLGIDVLFDKHKNLLQGKNIALITNHTGFNSELKSTIDLLFKEYNLAKLFAPEHGVRGEFYAGEYVPSYIDKSTGTTVYSLYGNTKKPTDEMLADVDVLIYDIQDIGTRAYTYIYTLSYSMEAASENGLDFLVLDRPNPLSGTCVDGNILDEKFSSFIGRYPIPYIYGMTVGELAKLFNSEFEINCRLKVIEMENWDRGMHYEDTGLNWIYTSPHIPYDQTPLYCAVTGIIGELGSVSVGVGYTMPFQLIGAPWVESTNLTEELNSLKLEGVKFLPANFKPFYGLYNGEKCSGVKIIFTDRYKVKPFKTGIAILHTLNKLYPNAGIFQENRLKMFHYAMGTDKITDMIKNKSSLKEIFDWYEKDLNKFMEIREKYLIY
ncbi:exo-beta-N-acetylmuramidase NamZ domain-containing protein [candidate division KSB1 bacterium]